MGNHRLPKRIMSEGMGNAGQRGPGRKKNEWTDCVAEDRRVFGITGDQSTAALVPEDWYNTVCKGGCRFMSAWVREQKKAP